VKETIPRPAEKLGNLSKNSSNITLKTTNFPQILAKSLISNGEKVGKYWEKGLTFAQKSV